MKHRCPMRVDLGPDGRGPGRPCNKIATREISVSTPGAANPHTCWYCEVHAASREKSDAAYWAAEREKDEAEARVKAMYEERSNRIAELATRLANIDPATIEAGSLVDAGRILGSLVLAHFFEEDDA